MRWKADQFHKNNLRVQATDSSVIRCVLTAGQYSVYVGWSVSVGWTGSGHEPDPVEERMLPHEWGARVAEASTATTAPSPAAAVTYKYYIFSTHFLLFVFNKLRQYVITDDCTDERPDNYANSCHLSHTRLRLHIHKKNIVSQIINFEVKKKHL